MDIFKQFAANTKQELSGKEIQIGENSWVTIARAGNKAYNRMLSKQYEAKRYSLSQKGDAAEKLAETMLVEVMANTILLGWRGEIEYQGEALEYSVDNAIKLLTLKDFREFISKQAEDFNNFKLTEDAEDVKN
jgi:hypothetical protein